MSYFNTWTPEYSYSSSLIACDNRYIWATNYSNNFVIRIDPQQNTTQIYSNSPGITDHFVTPYGIYSDNNYVWVTNFTVNSISRININTGDISVYGTDLSLNIPLGVYSNNTFVWVCNWGNGGGTTVTKLDMNGNLISTITVGSGPYALCGYNNHIYVTNSASSSISKINIETDVCEPIIINIANPTGITCDNVYLWISTYTSSKVLKINVQDTTIQESIDTSGTVWYISYFNNTIYTTNTTLNSITVINSTDQNPIPIQVPCYYTNYELTSPLGITISYNYFWVTTNQGINQYLLSTNYNVDGIDLVYKFLPYKPSTNLPIAVSTNYNFKTNITSSEFQDLNTLFAPYINGSQTLTNYFTGSLDLSQIFQPISNGPIVTLISSSYPINTIYDNGKYYGYIFVCPNANSTIIFNVTRNVVINYILCGGGAGGGAGSTYDGDNNGGGGGGGAGAYGYGSFNAITDNYTLVVGGTASGGIFGGGKTSANGNDGNDTSITQNSTSQYVKFHGGYKTGVSGANLSTFTNNGAPEASPNTESYDYTIYAAGGEYETNLPLVSNIYYLGSWGGSGCTNKGYTRQPSSSGYPNSDNPVAGPFQYNFYFGGGGGGAYANNDNNAGGLPGGGNGGNYSAGYNATNGLINNYYYAGGGGGGAAWGQYSGAGGVGASGLALIWWNFYGDE